MGDDLNKNLNSSGGLINQPSKSPLEQKVESSPPPVSQAPTPPPPPVAPPVPQSDLSSSPTPQPTEEPVKAPDTDDFIQSILSNSTPPSTQSNTEAQPSTGQQPSSMQEDNAEGPPTVELKNEMPEPARGMGQTPTQSLNMPPERNGGKAVANDVVAAMKSKGPAKSSPLKVIILPAIVLIVGLGAYLAYSKMSSTSVSSTDNATPVADLSEPTAPAALDAVTEPAATEVVTLTGDAKRKADLFTIQGYLKDYQAQEGTYPVAATLTLLKTGNVLEAELAKLSYQLPVDPDTTKSYAYKSDGQTFTLTAILEDSTDPEGSMEGGLYIFKVTPDTIKPASSAVSSSVGSSTLETAVGATVTAVSSADNNAAVSGLPTEENMDSSDSLTGSTQGQY